VITTSKITKKGGSRKRVQRCNGKIQCNGNILSSSAGQCGKMAQAGWVTTTNLHWEGRGRLEQEGEGNRISHSRTRERYVQGWQTREIKKGSKNLSGYVPRRMVG